jgi:hypothetical protein
MQVAYNRAQVGTRAAEWINPKQGEILIPDREAAYKHIASFERQLLVKNLPRHKRAELLIAKSMVYEAIGDQKMMSAAEEAFALTKTSTTAHMLAVALHHFGRIREACSYYELAFRFPHEQGFNVDLAYTQALLFQGKWSEAHRMTLGLKKRMVYAAYLPEWDRRSTTLSIVSEGGFGDLIQCGRWIPILTGMGINVTVYLPPFFWESGFVDLWKRQPWCPPIKILTETPKDVPAVGFFDLPAVFDVQPENVPISLTFQAEKTLSEKYRSVRTDRLPNSKIPTVGFCFAARQSETPLVPDGIYRALTEQQAERILQSGFEVVRFVNLQKDLKLDQFAAPLISRPEIRSWEDTCAIIENLDAVITVDTAVAHLAAAMGKPTYVLLSGASDWKFGMSGETTAWYPSMRLVRNNGWGFEDAIRSLCEQTIPQIQQAGTEFSLG